MNFSPRRLFLLLCVVSLSATDKLLAWSADQIDFPGDVQGWSLGSDSTKYTGPDGSTEWFRYQFAAGSDDADYNFKMVTGNNWDQDYGGNLAFPKNNIGVVYYQQANDSASKLSGGAINGKRYVFTVKNPGLANTYLSVMELSGAITAISSVSRNESTGLITVNLSQTPAAEEKVFIRYTSDNWVTSSYVQATVSGSSATATILPLENGKTYAWYALTTTASAGDLAASPDLLALSWNNNNGSNYTFSTPAESIVLSVNGTNGNYTTSKYFIDEVAGDEKSLAVSFYVNAPNLTAVEVFTNLNRRDKANADANGDGVPDGILSPVGDTIAAGNDSNYYKAYAMTDNGGSNFSLTLPVNKTGSYRLAVRWKVAGDNNWRWYTNIAANRRDHAVVVSPVQSRDIRMYELNVFNIEASGKDFANRSTIEDLSDRTGRIHTGNDRVNKFDLGYLQNLGVNWVWFQPYHPYGWEGRHLSAANIRSRDASQSSADTLVWNGASYDSNVNFSYQLGSPYAVKNFWEIEPRMSAAFSGNPAVEADTTNPTNRAAAMTAFQNFMADADSAGISLMPDAAFNHGAWDIELGQAGLDYIMPAAGGSGWTAADLMHNREVRFFSKKADYAQRASYYTDFFSNDVAPGPDRGDFGKWLDVVDIFFGRYAALVSQNPADNNNYKSEADWFNYDATTGNFDGITQGVWKYFANYAVYWLGKGRAAGSNRNSTSSDGDVAARYAWDARGIDGLRCDFGQGLPPQCWEYIINTARSYKWSFVFMSESLDGGEVTYRSNRHFDILNENIVFPGKAATQTSDYRAMFEARRSAYGQGLVLLNTVSHDEDNYVDPWQAFIRYSVYGTIDGAPLIFPGQEHGLSQYWGYDLYEMNFGKPVPHFKTYNSMMTMWGNNDHALNQLMYAYSAVNAARSFSPALRSSNRYFLDQKSGSAHASIFSVAKYETINASPVASDVIFAFANLNRDVAQSGAFNVNIDTDSDGSNDFGLKSARTYNARNVAAHLGQSATRRDAWLWGGAGVGLTGANLLSNGIYVGLNRIPAESTQAAWAAAPFEVQYLKVYDTTAPGNVSGTVSANFTNGYRIGATATFTWNSVAADAEGIVPKYNVEISANGGSTNIVVAGNSYTYSVATDTEVSARVRAVNPYDTASGSAFTGWTGNAYILTPGGDFDGDGTSNQTENDVGGNPFVAKTNAAVTLDNLVQAYNGSARSITGVTDPSGLVVNFTYEGSAAAPTNPGTYAVAGTISDVSYRGTAAGTLVIHGPSPAADFVTKTNSATQHRYSFAELLANDTRVSTNGTVLTNNGLNIVGVTAGTGNSVSIRSSFVILTPSTNSPETFTYQVTDGTVTNSATVTVTLAANTNVVYSTLQIVGTGMAVYDGSDTRVTNYFIGVPNQSYGIQYKGELSNAAWDSASPTNSGPSGSFGVHFQKAGNHAADWNGSMFFRGYLTNTNQ